MKYILLLLVLMTFFFASAQEESQAGYHPWSIYSDFVAPLNPYFSSVSLGATRSYDGQVGWDIEYKYFFGSALYTGNSEENVTGHGLHLGYKYDASGFQFGIHLSYDRIQLNTLEIASRLGGQYAQLMMLDRSVDQVKLLFSWGAMSYMGDTFIEPFFRLGIMHRNTAWDMPGDINMVFEDLNWFEREPPTERLTVGSKVELVGQVGMRFGFGL